MVLREPAAERARVTVANLERAPSHAHRSRSNTSRALVALVTELKPVRDILVAMGLDPTPPARAPPWQGDFAWNEPA